ncbi:hypothetical protein GCM10010329_48570 [Streptomyces spiroverticillatus]|uniref:Uncharacterized protein n=1 Tax=Streptomyces finlayi TaxID=67296 RepID=A0A918X1S5_9ACTN|nr:hypothetical protein GCM10010329_48570 [Streptomyces spiroverticillatus]GHD02678.1 hypothetical protein GCM10010334_49520 [Streptomyces finlayi]
MLGVIDATPELPYPQGVFTRPDGIYRWVFHSYEGKVYGAPPRGFPQRRRTGRTAGTGCFAQRYFAQRYFA